MKKCLKVSLGFTGSSDFIQSIQKHGSKLLVEGNIKIFPAEKMLKIIVCGTKENVDKFIDILHKESVKIGAPEIQVEPFIRDKDYRGVLRIIE